MKHNNLEQAIYKNWKQSIYLIGNNRIFEHGVFYFYNFHIRSSFYTFLHSLGTHGPSIEPHQIASSWLAFGTSTDLQLVVIIVIQLIELSLEIIIVLNVPSIMVKNLKMCQSNSSPPIPSKGTFCQWSTWAKNHSSHFSDKAATVKHTKCHKEIMTHFLWRH